MRPRLLHHPSRVYRVLHVAHEEVRVDALHQPIPKLDRLGEVVTGVDVHERKGDPGRMKRLPGQMYHGDRVLAAAEQQHRAFELCGDLAHDVDRLGLELVEVRLVIVGHEVVWMALKMWAAERAGLRQLARAGRSGCSGSVERATDRPARASTDMSAGTSSCRITLRSMRAPE